MANVNKFIIDEHTKISDITGGEFSTLKYNAAGENYSGPLVKEVINMCDKLGIDVTNTKINNVGATFKNIIMRYQEKYKFPVNGIVDDDLLHDMYNRLYGEDANNNGNNSIQSNDGYNSNGYYDDGEDESSGLLNAHYDPFFLNSSGKVYRKNHKDIIISLGNDANVKIIKDVFMRSVSVQVDTSGNPISEVYSFIARDIKESDAPEDIGKYTGDAELISASSDIKYSYTSLYKDI